MLSSQYGVIIDSQAVKLTPGVFLCRAALFDAPFGGCLYAVYVAISHRPYTWCYLVGVNTRGSTVFSGAYLLDVKAKVDHIAVTDNIVFTF